MAREKKTIVFIVYPGFSLLELIGLPSLLKGLEMGPYKTVVVGERTGRLESDTPLPIMIDKTFDDLQQPHGLFVIGGSGVNTIKALASDKLLEYVRKAGEHAELIGSVGSGTLVLAAAGLLNGKQAATHWAYAKVLERLGAHYTEKRYLEDGKFFTAAGGSGAMDLALYLLDKLAGRKRANIAQLFSEYDPQPPFGGIDWAKVNKDGLEIALVIYPGLTPLDLIGPLQVLSTLARFRPEFQPVVVAETTKPLEGDNGVTFIPNKIFAEVPHPFAILVPGGGGPTLRAMSNKAIRSYVKNAAETAEVVASVCTGALILASVGLLENRQATTHWAYEGILENLGATYNRKRWVEDDKFIISAGVSAGIDTALRLVARLTDEATSRQVQHWLDYDPQPPFGKLDYSNIPTLGRMMRGTFRLIAPFVTAKPKRLTRQHL